MHWLRLQDANFVREMVEIISVVLGDTMKYFAKVVFRNSASWYNYIVLK